MAEQEKHTDSATAQEIEELHEHHHHHDDDCCCGHDHEHEHHHHHDDDDDCCCGHDHEHEHHHHHDDDCCCGHDHEHEHHHHHHDDDCCCGHDHEHEHHHHHDDDCCCGHDHEHDHHHHDEDDCCGHDHEHEHHHHHDDDDCCCGHDHEHEHHHHHEHTAYGKNGQRVYTLENLGCAHCAAKMQHQISQLDGIDDCVLVYETKQLRVKGENPDALLPKIREICSNIESEVKVIAPEEEQEDEKGSHPLAEMLIGAALFVAGLVIPVTAVKIVLMVAAYLLLGRHVLLTAVKNIGRGQVFDENFLMAVATIGAWAVGSFDEAVGVMLFYRVGEYFEDRAVDRSRKQIMDAIDLRPETVNLVKPDGSVEVLPAEQAEVGDLVLVRPGDCVPLDGKVAEGETRLDTSAVTGEPVPVRVSTGDSVISGCVNTDGAVKIRVTHVLAESMVQRILDSVENAAARKPKIDRFITRFSRVYTPAVVLIALLTAIVPSLVTGDWHKWV